MPARSRRRALELTLLYFGVPLAVLAILVAWVVIGQVREDPANGLYYLASLVIVAVTLVGTWFLQTRVEWPKRPRPTQGTVQVSKHVLVGYGDTPPPEEVVHPKL